jgi:preprotein translocase subunit YajC
MSADPEPPMPRPYASPDPLTEELDDAPLEQAMLPPRPRRRLATRWTAGTTVVLLLALGFIGGVLVQRGRQPAATGQTTAAGAPFGAGRFGQGAGTSGAADGAAPVAGKVSSVDGSTLYVTTNQGTTVKVRTSGSAKVTRTAKSSVSAVHPGDTVVITGSTAANGTVTAAQLTATASGVTAGGFGGFGGFGGGGGRTGGQPGAAPPASGG